MGEIISQRRLIAENTLKHILSIVIAFAAWGQIFGSIVSAKAEALGAIGTVTGLIALASLTAYFNFSFSLVGKTGRWRLLAYLCTFLLYTAFIISLEVILAIASVWIPGLAIIWVLIVGMLFLGSMIFDYLDLMRIGLDIAAIGFYEKAIVTKQESFHSLLELIRQGIRLPQANVAIGRAMLLIGERKKYRNFIEGGNWIIRNSDKKQHVIDFKVAGIMAQHYEKNPEMAKLAKQLRKGLGQAEADTIIVKLLELVQEQ